MNAEQPGARLDRRAQARDRLRARPRPARADGRRSRSGASWAFGIVALAVLGIGGYLAFGDLGGQRDAASIAGAVPVRMSMAGFTPAEVRVPAGRTIELELWTKDAPFHLDGGVHTLISEELGLYEELPGAGMSGESRLTVTIPAPDTPGSYDIYCDTCCGGKDSPAMHGRLIVEA